MTGFAMLERDTVTGLSPAVYREENPGTGRWDSQDPLGFGGGTNNLYEYVQNTPYTDVDPSGLDGLSDYWYYLTHPGEMDGDLQQGQRIAIGVATTAIGTATVLTGVGLISTGLGMLGTGGSVTLGSGGLAIGGGGLAASGGVVVATTTGTLTGAATVATGLTVGVGGAYELNCARFNFDDELPTLDSTGKVHGELPDIKILGKYSRDGFRQFLEDLKGSVAQRI